MKLEKLARRAQHLAHTLARRAPKVAATAIERGAVALRGAQVSATAIERGADAFVAGTSKGPALTPPAAKSVFGGAPTFTGFDATKLAADLKRVDGVAQSAKYTFAKLAQASGTMPRTKAEAEQWFNEHIKPGLEAEGFGVDWVKGDKALIRTRENPQGEVVDFVRGADSNDPNYTALAWQPETPGGATTPSAPPAMATSELPPQPPSADVSDEDVEHAVDELRKLRGFEHLTALELKQRLARALAGR